MKANELRIENFIRYGVGFYRVKSIHTESVLKEEVHVYIELNQKLSNYCVSINEIQPIPLTEELLLKCGFENEDDWLELFVNDNLSITWFGYLGLSVDGVFVFFNEKKYLHQLQNLYFALTGEELNIEL